jgi:hypothetical protein
MEAKALSAYIDESGDEGVTRLGWWARGVESASTEWLILGAVVVSAEVDASLFAPSTRRTPTLRPLHRRSSTLDLSRLSFGALLE